MTHQELFFTIETEAFSPCEIQLENILKVQLDAYFLLKTICAGYSADGKMIGITEPRRVAATAMAARVAQELSKLPLD